MKKKLSLILALSMMLSLVPMASFASSDNSVSKVVKVKDDATLNNATDVPLLKIENDDNDFSGTERFQVVLNGADWLDKDDTVSNTVYYGAAATKIATEEDFEAMMAREIEGSTTFLVAGDVTVRRVKNSTLEVTMDTTGFDKTTVAKVPMLVEMDSKDDVKVTIKAMDSNVTGGSYTFAVGASGDTKTTVEEIEDFTDEAELETITIEELAVGTMEDKDTIEFKLPSDFRFSMKDSDMTVKGAGSFGGINITNLTEVSKTTAASKRAVGDVVIDGRNLEITVDFGNHNATRGTLYIDGLKVMAESDADYDDVEMTISSEEDNVSKEDVVVAKYVDYDVEVKADGDAKEILAGDYTTDAKEDEHELQTLIIKENVANAWLTSRKTRVEFPSWVKIRDIKVDDYSDFDSQPSITIADQGENDIEFTIDDIDRDTSSELDLIFYVSVEAGHEGDITATVSGSSLGKEYDVVLGKAINPVKVEVEPVADVRTGIKNQEIGKIVITETKDEAIKEGSLVLELDDDVEWNEVPTIKVTKGNLDLDIEGADVKNGTLTIPVDSDSSKPATIEISNISLDLDRTIAEGDLNVQVGGDAIVRNDKDTSGVALDAGGFQEEYAVEVAIARVITPADANTQAGQEVKFVIGNAEYMVGEEVQTADVAPYIKDGRTMLSLSFAAKAMGVKKDNIMWDNATRTATIFKGERTAQVTIGSNKLTVNGTPVMMDTTAEIKDGRTMLPVSFVAKALGADVSWDPATRTVTIK